MGIVSIASTLATDVLATLWALFGLNAFPRLKLLLVVVSLSTTILIAFLCLPLAWALVGCSPGKALCGLRVTDTNGDRISLLRAVFRLLGYWISALPLFLGFAWSLFDDQRQAWHDKLAGTHVVYSDTLPLKRLKQP